VAAVGVARRVGVVLEQVDIAADTLVGQPLLGIDEQVFEHSLAGAVVGDQLCQAVAFGGGVFGVAAHIEVQPGAVAEENVRAAAPGNHAPEQVAGYFVGRQASVSVEGAGDTEFGFNAHDSTLHNSSVLAERATGAEPPQWLVESILFLGLPQGCFSCIPGTQRSSKLAVWTSCA